MSPIFQPGHGEDGYSIGRFIAARAKALRLSRTDLVRRLGYRDLNSGHRALTNLLVHGLVLPLIAANLAAALEVQQNQIDQIVGPTSRPRSKLAKTTDRFPWKIAKMRATPTEPTAFDRPTTLHSCFLTSTGCICAAATQGFSTGSSLRPVASNSSNGRHFGFGADGSQCDADRDFSTDHVAPSVPLALASVIPGWAVLDLIEPAVWRIEKTEAIDPASDFWWMDDKPSEHDEGWLRAHNRRDRLIEVSCDRDPDALLHARSRLPGARWRSG